MVRGSTPSKKPPPNRNVRPRISQLSHVLIGEAFHVFQLGCRKDASGCRSTRSFHKSQPCLSAKKNTRLRPAAKPQLDNVAFDQCSTKFRLLHSCTMYMMMSLISFFLCRMLPTFSKNSSSGSSKGNSSISSPVLQVLKIIVMVYVDVHAT